MLLVIDDLQWCDPETLAWIHYLIRTSADRAAGRQPRILLACALQTGVPDSGAWSHGPVEPTLRHGKSYDTGRGHKSIAALIHSVGSLSRLTEIRLQPLERTAITQIVQKYTGEHPNSTDLDALITYTRGNPFFLMAALRAGLNELILDRSRHPDGVWPVAPSLASMVRNRLTTLRAPARDLLALASVIGTPVTLEGLMELTGWQKDMLVSAVDELWSAGLLEDPGNNLSQHGYWFHHECVRSVVYADLGPARRQMLHLRVADYLRRSNERRTDLYEQASHRLAAHYAKAARIDEALRWYLRAIDYALEHCGNQQALHLIERATSLLRRLPDEGTRVESDLELSLRRGIVLVALSGYGAPAVIDAFSRASALAQSLGRPVAAPVQRGLAIAYIVRNRLHNAHRLGQQLLGLALDGHRADETSAACLVVEAHYVLAVALFWLGRFPQAREQFRLALDAYDPAEQSEHLARYSQDPAVTCLVRLAYTNWYLGHTIEAVTQATAAVARGEAIAHPYSLAHALVWSQFLHAHMGDVEGVEAAASRAVALCREYGLGMWLSMSEIFVGWVEFHRGRRDAGLQLMDSALAALYETGAEYALPYNCLLAECHLETGNRERARELIEHGLVAVAQNDEHCSEAELLRIQAAILRDVGATRSKVVTVLTRALAVAERQSATSLRLRILSDWITYELEYADSNDMVAAFNRQSDLAALIVSYGDQAEFADLRMARAVVAHTPFRRTLSSTNVATQS